MKKYLPWKENLVSHIPSPFPIEHFWEENSTTTLSESLSYENHKTIRNLQEALKCLSGQTCGWHRDLHLETAKRNNWCILLLARARDSNVYVHCVIRDFVRCYVIQLYSRYILFIRLGLEKFLSLTGFSLCNHILFVWERECDYLFTTIVHPSILHTEFELTDHLVKSEFD